MKAVRKKVSTRGSKPGERRGGRQKGTPNKSTAEIKEMARQHGPSAIERLVLIMNTRDDVPAAQIAAAKELLDRAYGKATQTISGDNDMPAIRAALTVAFVGSSAG